MSETLADEVRALARLDLEGLRAEWRSRYGPVPKLRSPELLRYLLAWRIQAAAIGDLDVATRRRLARSGSKPSRLEGLRPGVKLAREWKGVPVEVEVISEGFVHAGRTYASLSQVARAVTGVRWNGPRFFGLRQDAG